MNTQATEYFGWSERYGLPKPRTIETLQEKNLQWRRIRSAIAHKVSDYPPADWGKIDAVEIRLRALIPFLGYWSINRKALTGIGSNLARLEGKPVTLLVPICGYNEDGTKVSSAVKLVQSHLTFIERVADILRIERVQFLFPTHTATKGPEERQRLKDTVSEIQSRLVGSHHQAVSMEEVFPSIVEKEEAIKSDLKLTMNEEMLSLFKVLQTERQHYYSRRSLPSELWDEWTIKGIAEFTALGRFAREANHLICCHSTGRIRCLVKAGAGVLHNPIGIV